MIIPSQVTDISSHMLILSICERAALAFSVSTVFQQGIREVLENNEARFGRMLEAGLWLQKAGCQGVGVSTAKLVARWKTLFGESEQEHSRLEKRWNLRCR